MKLPYSISSITLCISAIALASTTAIAQEAPEEIVITGQMGEVPDSVRSLSYPVSYADLDLTTDEGRRILRDRVKHTARFLCEKLGETDTSSALIPSCQDATVRDAMSRVETLEASSAPRDTTWVRPSEWEAPYPHVWSEPHP